MQRLATAAEIARLGYVSTLLILCCLSCWGWCQSWAAVDASTKPLAATTRQPEPQCPPYPSHSHDARTRSTRPTHATPGAHPHSVTSGSVVAGAACIALPFRQVQGLLPFCPPEPRAAPGTTSQGNFDLSKPTPQSKLTSITARPSDPLLGWSNRSHVQ